VHRQPGRLRQAASIGLGLDGCKPNGVLGGPTARPTCHPHVKLGVSVCSICGCGGVVWCIHNPSSTLSTTTMSFLLTEEGKRPLSTLTRVAPDRRSSSNQF
jgi:hypothetical protein